MGGGFQFIDIVFFALVAVFVILRLRSVLGRRTGHEQPPTPFPGRDDRRVPGTNRAPGDDNVVQLPGSEAEAEEVQPETPLGAALTQIKLADPNFDPADFQEKSTAAFEYIVMAFAEGETAKLKPLLSKEVFEGFAGAIKEREEAKQTLSTTLARIKEAEITDASMEGRTASVTVRYVSEQINVTRDAEDKVVDGDPDHFQERVDIWTYERNTRSSDPNWTLVATEMPE
jgi:predicted lipid-binding transport protein (Tim44 family)